MLSWVAVVRLRFSSPFIRAGFTGGLIAVGQSLPVRERYIGPNRP